MADRPVVSIIVPTRDRSAALVGFIASLAHCRDVSFSWELVVVDNGSTDGTAEAAGRAARELGGVRFRCVREPVPGLHAARHRGAREAEADVLVFVDDDIEASPSWLSALGDEFLDPAVELVGGPSHPRYMVAPPAWVEWTWATQPDGTRWCGALSLLEGGDVRREIDPVFVWGLNFAIRRDTLRRLKGFNPDALPWDLRRCRGDGETGLSLKARAAGIKAWYRPEALVYHVVPATRLTEEYFLRRSYLQGISDSFTAMRADEDLEPRQAESLYRRGRRLAGRAVRPLRRGARRDPAFDLKRRIAAAHAEGYGYHQVEAASDPALLAWVLREDYLIDADPRTVARSRSGDRC